MKIWFEEYRKAMRGTRLIGIVGALAIVLCVAREVSRFFWALSIHEELIAVAVIRKELSLTGFAVLVGIIALSRVFVLAWSRSVSYKWHVLNWWLLVLGLCVYIWSVMPVNTSTVCDDNGVCFGIYDIRDNTNFVAIGGTLFILLSFFRFLATIAYAVTRNRLK
ncbi:MAG: hypothetical protein ACKVQW_00130 [Pyrinomonadaceae bacterium]